MLCWVANKIGKKKLVELTRLNAALEFHIYLQKRMASKSPAASKLKYGIEKIFLYSIVEFETIYEIYV